MRRYSGGFKVIWPERNGVADYVYLLEVGEVVEHGPVSKMKLSQRVKEAYLGG